jgi:hypothetical protein
MESAGIELGLSEYATRFVNDFLHVVAIYDDLIDKDKPVPDDDIHRAMYSAFFAIPRNPFYMANFAVLNPLMENAVRNWQLANELEKQQQDGDLHISFVVRSSYVDLLCACVQIERGQDMATFLQIRRFIHDEGLGEYIKEMTR